MPVTSNINNSITASYIYVSGSTNDLYFTQNGDGRTNTSRLRWLESNLYTGLLSGGVISASLGSTSFTITSGSALIVSMAASTSSIDPYPTTKKITWGNISSPLTYSGSARITYVGIDGNGQIIQQTVPWGSTDVTQWDTQVELGVVLHLSGSIVTGVYNAPQVSYGFSQRTDDFLRAFGPLKISGHTLQASGSTLSIIKTAGTAYNDGANYVINPNHPSTVIEPAVNVSKIYRYYLSGSTAIIDTGIGGAGYTAIDPTLYNNNGTLTTVPTNGNNLRWTIQRVFWIPNSPTNAFLVYYGNTLYASVVDAQNGIGTESFTEAPNTAQNGILIGYIIVAGNETNLQNATIVQGGLFRSVNGIGSSNTSPISTTLSTLSDVSVGTRTAGDLLYYNGSQWINNKTLTGNYGITGSLNVSAGVVANLTGTASYALSSSYSFAATSASYAATSTSASYATNALSASYHSGSGIISNAVSSSYALTASYALNAGAGAGFPYSGSAVVTGSLYVSGSGITGSFSGSLLGTASYASNANSSSYAAVAVSASYALSSSYAFQSTSASFATYAISASNAPGYTVNFTQATPATTWSFTHNLNTRNPIVQVYDTTYKQIIPNQIVAIDAFNAQVLFDFSQSGYVVMSNGGGLYVTGSTSLLYATSSVTWSFQHNLNSQYINFTAYDSSNNVIIPSGIKAISSNYAELYFAVSQSGVAVAQFSGIGGSPNAASASYALTSSYAISASAAVSSSYATTASYLAPVTNGYVVLSQVSSSLNFADDTAAAAGGVPLGGLYRNGNFIMIRLT
jgi:hypothetical protein